MMSVIKGGVLKGKDVHKALMPGMGCAKGTQQYWEWHGVRAAVSPGKADKTAKVGRRRLERVLIAL